MSYFPSKSFGEISEEKNENAGTAKLILYVVNIGVMFWKVDSKAYFVLTLPSSETFFVKSYSRGSILQLDAARRGFT